MTSHNRIAIACLVIFTSGILLAKSPSLTHIFPSGGATGTTVEVEFGGSFESWPPQTWVNCQELTVGLSEEKGKGTITIQDTASVGPKLIRFFNAEGASEPCFFLVSSRHEALEVEPNDLPRDATSLAHFPAAVNGRLSKRGDTDSYRVQLQKDQWLVANLFAYRLRAGADLLLQIVRPDGIKVAFNHDHFHLDPFLTFKAPASAEYTVQVMGFDYPAKSDVRLGGGSNFYYRLELDTGPYLGHAFPMALQRGATTEVTFHGWNLPKNHASVSVPAVTSHDQTDSNQHWIQLQESPLPFSIPVRDEPQCIEKDSDPTPQRLPVPSSVSGTIEAHAEEDQYQVHLEKGQSYTFSAVSKAAIHRFDPWLAIRSEAGKELKRDDDSRQDRDPTLTWTATETAPHHLALGNLLGTGSSNFFYHLSVEKNLPAYTATLSANQWTLQPGTTNTISVALKRQHGHDHPLQFRFKNLPVTVRQVGGDLAGKDTKAEIQLVTAPEAPPFLGETLLHATDLTTGQARIVPATFLGTSVNNGVPGGFKDLVLTECDRLWITIPPKPEPAEEPSADEAKP